MKTILVTTTINVPRVLAAYRAAMPGVQFLVIGDTKTPDAEVSAFLATVGKCKYYSYAEQSKLGYESHDSIGPAVIQRRNIGFLEALKLGADVVYSCDDDNYVMDGQHGFLLRSAFERALAVEVESRTRWFDPGQHLVPPATHRGFPQHIRSEPVFNNVVGPKIGVVAGLCLGDPDVSALTRIESHPDVTQAAELMQTGCVVNPQTWTVFNSQNSAVRREFIPAWNMWTQSGRFDDIFASMVVQRVMRERGYRVHFGKPFALQQRNAHDLIKDLRAEVDGYASIELLAKVLDTIQLPAKSVIDDCRRIWETLSHVDFVNPKTVETATAYLNDAEKVL